MRLLLAKSARSMGDDAGAPAERHPIKPPQIWRHGEIDEEQNQHRRHIGEEVDGEAARLPIDENALATPRLAHEERKGMGGDRRAPTDQYPDEPGILRREPQIDRGEPGSNGDERREVNEKDAHRQVFEHGSPSLSGLPVYANCVTASVL